MDSKALVLLSGGQDSSTCLAWAMKQFDGVRAVIFRYGQRHEKEVEYALRLAEKWRVPTVVVPIGPLGALMHSSLTDHTRPVRSNGGYQDLPNTFTPGRNLLFLTIASSIAVQDGVANVVTGVCETDYSGYPDCRRVFIDSFQHTFTLALGQDSVEAVRVHTPLMKLSKAQTFALAEELGVLKEIVNDTLTCYHGNETGHAWGRGCGQCPACLIRERGFREWKRTSNAAVAG